MDLVAPDPSAPPRAGLGTLDEAPWDTTYAARLSWLGARLNPQPVTAPGPIFVNDDLATDLGLDPDALRSPRGTANLAGNQVPNGARPLAQAYAGHQFGQYSPQLGDGRAHLLGELRDRHGHRRDVALKGSGRTPFSRGGDGRAAVGPMLREVLVGEALHALGIPTTRALAVVATGETVQRDTPLPGAVLTRVAASHLRVGTAQYVRDRASVERQASFAAYVRERHHPHVVDGDHLGLLAAVVSAQARLLADWMALGFVHGVMNTDNMALSGESIDFGPCAFLEAHDPQAVFSSIDTAGRYRFGAQPSIAQWNLARYAETMLPLLVPDAADETVVGEVIEAATQVLRGFEGEYHAAYLARMRAKTGLTHAAGTDPARDEALIADLLDLMIADRLDHTRTFRLLGRVLRGETGRIRMLVTDSAGWDRWQQRWVAAFDGADVAAAADAMDRVNPAYIPRNHLVEEALAAATEGDLAPFEELLSAIRDPFIERPGRERYAAPAPEGFTEGYVTYCGT